ncbi:MAG: hypothetical protein ABR499_22915 [Gemmatimonadaceae bacterium]
MQPDVVRDDRPAEPTLGELLTRTVRASVPARLYQLLHLAFPLAVDFAFRGWWRPAGWALAITAFGAWGLADRWLWSAAEQGFEQPRSWVVRSARIGRAVAGTVAATIAGVLALELFLRLLGAPPGH